MATQQNSNELRVEKDADIEEKLKECNIDLAATTFEAEEIQKVLEDGTTGTSDSSATNGAKVTFEDGKAGNIVQKMVPITNTVQTPALDLDDKKKEAIKRRAEKSKAEQEQKEAEEKDR